MDPIEFRCENCGSIVKRNLVPRKHAVRGEAKTLNREENCCERPQYSTSDGPRIPRQRFKPSVL